MAEKRARSATTTTIPAAMLDRIAAELAARRRPMTLAELLAFIGE